MKFDLHLIVPTKLVGPIVELLENDGVLIKIEPHHTQHRPHKNHKRRIAPEATGEGTMLSFLQTIAPGTRFSNRDVVKFFTANGYALGSSSSRLSQAKKSGLVRGVGNGLYEVVKK